MKVWITKYALTSGVFTAEADLLEGGRIVASVNERGAHFITSFRGQEWHSTTEKAKADAERRKATAISAYRGYIERLESMKIEVPA